MHPALRLLVRVWLATAFIMLIASLAACGGGGDACHAGRAAPTQRTLSFQAPVGVLTSTAMAPAAPADLRVTTTVSLGGTGSHSVLLRLTSARPGQPAQVVSSAVEIPAGQRLDVTLTGRIAPGAQTVSVAFALIGVSAEGQTLTADDTRFSFCEPPHPTDLEV